jgi:hypothetical protein
VSRGASSAVPLQSPETGSSYGRHVAVAIASSRAVHASFRVLPKGGIAVWVRRSPHDLFPSRGRPSGCFRVLRSAATVRLSPNPLVDFALLQSLTRVGPPVVTRRAERYVVDGLHSPGVSAPSAHEVAGSDQRRVCLARLCGAFRLSQPPDASFPPKPCRSCFIPAALMGFALQRVSLPNAGAASRPLLPLVTLSSTVARGERPSPLRLYAAAWCPSPLRGAVSVPRARAQSVSGASSGV